MQWKRASIVLAAVSVALSFGVSIPATAAGDKAPMSVHASGLLATARMELPDGGMALVQGMDVVERVRMPGSRPTQSDLPTGLVAMNVPGPVDDPTIMARELWCMTDAEGAVTIAEDLMSAEANFTCDALFVDVVCTAWEGEECVGATEIVNESLSDTLTVSASWVGVGETSRIMSFTKSFGPDWWMSHTQGTERMALATGSVRGLEVTYLEGPFDEASLSAIKDTSIQRIPAEPDPEP